jgi:hypothetical protein
MNFRGRLALPVASPFAELRQILLVDAIDLSLHLGMPPLE